MAYKVGMRKGVNINRVVSKISITIIALWVGGTIINEIGAVVNGTTSGFYEGLELIGWTVTNGTVQQVDGTGILAVVGIIGIASVVLEFLEFRMK